MTFPRCRHLLAVLGAILLLLGACSGDDSNGESGDQPPPAGRDAYVTALEAELRGDASELPAGDQAPTCVAGALVDTVGIAHLEAEGISVEEFADADTLADLGVDIDSGAIDRLGERISGCIDFIQLLADTAPPGYECLVDSVDGDAMSRAFAEDLALGGGFDPSLVMFETATPACAETVFLATGLASGDLDEAQAACLADNLDDEVPLRILHTTAQGGSPSEADAGAMAQAFSACGVEPPG